MTEHIHCKSQPQPDAFLPGKSPTWWCCALGSLSTLTLQLCRAESLQEGALFHITHPKGERMSKRRWEIWEKHTKHVLCSDSCGYHTSPQWKKVGPLVQLIAGLSIPQSYGWPLLTNSLLAAIQRTAHLQIRSSLLVRPSEPQTRRLQGARARLCVSTRCNTLPDLTRAFFCFPHRCPQKSGAQGLRAACFVNL